MNQRSITKGLLIKDGTARTLAAFSYVKFTGADDCEAELLLLCCDDVYSATLSPVDTLFKQVFMCCATRGIVDVSISHLSDQGRVLHLRSRDVPGKCILPLHAVRGGAKDSAMQVRSWATRQTT
jgi:hypothetical protein